MPKASMSLYDLVLLPSSPQPSYFVYCYTNASIDSPLMIGYVSERRDIDQLINGSHLGMPLARGRV